MFNNCINICKLNYVRLQGDLICSSKNIELLQNPGNLKYRRKNRLRNQAFTIFKTVLSPLKTKRLVVNPKIMSFP